MAFHEWGGAIPTSGSTVFVVIVSAAVESELLWCAMSAPPSSGR